MMFPDISELYVWGFATDAFMCEYFSCDFNTPDNNACSGCEYGSDYQENYVRTCSLKENNN